MRILVAGPPKTGNIWITCLLAEIYGLKILDHPPQDAHRFEQAGNAGWFTDQSIFHQHYAPIPPVLDVAHRLDARLVSIIRNPYDTFVSLYHFVQKHPGQFSRFDKPVLYDSPYDTIVSLYRYLAGKVQPVPQHPLSKIFGKPIDHPDVIEFIGQTTDGFGIHLVLAKRWLKTEDSKTVRYEELRASPEAALEKLCSEIRPVEQERIRLAVNRCDIQNMRKNSRKYRKHIRKGETGGWKNVLNGRHLQAFMNHARLIEDLGYKTYPDELSVGKTGGKSLP